MGLDSVLGCCFSTLERLSELCDATPEWVKHNLKRTYPGCEAITYTTFITGEKSTTCQLWRTDDLDNAQMRRYVVAYRFGSKHHRKGR